MSINPRSPRAKPRWMLLALGVTVPMLMLVGVALAVHDVSKFQLDTPSADAQTATGTVTHLEDWDLICKDNPLTCTFKASAEPLGTTTAYASSHVADGALNATIFTGGGSKDISGIQSGAWAWKDEAGGLPDKDNLLHAYAARYAVPSSDECPVGLPGGGTNTDGTETCSLIYFGSDRYANDGDATQAFWFLQNKVTLGSNKIGGGFGFTGSHRDGDLLIISEFSNGGTKSTITVYKWVGTDATGGLSFVAGGEDQKCGGSTPDPFCGIVNENESPTYSPWTFLDKAGSADFRQGELFEAGINLSDPSIGLGDECFSSFVAETRSSTSVTAQLKDFVLGEFEICGASIATTPQYTTVEISSGLTVYDSATVSVTGGANVPAPTGDVEFFLCGPSLTAITSCDPAGKTAFDTKNLSGATPSGNNYTVQSSGAPISQIGYYCFAAKWPGDTNYAEGPYIDGSSTECFQVTPKPPTIVTTSVPTGGNVVPGTSVYDTVSVTGDVGTATGTVNFYLCQPSQVTTNGGDCSSGGTKIGGTKTLSGGNATSDSTTNTTAIGKYCWRAEYTRDASSPYQSGTHTNSTTECFEVVTQPPTIVTTSSQQGTIAVGASVTDTVTVSGAYGIATGTVDFILCQPSDVTAAGCPSGSGTKVGATKTLSGGTATSDAASGATTTSVGKYCWRAEYTRDSTSPYQSGTHTNPTTECFTVQDSTSLVSAQEWLPNDSATVTATGGTALNGTLAIQLYETADCTGTPVAGQLYSKTLTNATSATDRTLATSNSTYKVLVTKSVSWKVVFTPSAGSNVTGSTHCESTSLTITN